jgi:hypothetical protein
LGLRIQQISEIRKKGAMQIARQRAVCEDGYLIRRFFRGSIREEFVDQLKRMKDLPLFPTHALSERPSRHWPI